MKNWLFYGNYAKIFISLKNKITKVKKCIWRRVLDIVKSVATELNLKVSQIENTINLYDEGATVPFSARYRKEVTGNLDEEQIREVIEKVTYYRNLEKRK